LRASTASSFGELLTNAVSVMSYLALLEVAKLS
jgi:hypothetical protein